MCVPWRRARAACWPRGLARAAVVDELVAGPDRQVSIDYLYLVVMQSEQRRSSAKAHVT